MSYYEERLKKAELNCKYVEAGFFGTIEDIANEIEKGSVADVAHVIRKLKLACDVMEDALEEADSAYERLQEERESDEAVRIEA